MRRHIAALAMVALFTAASAVAQTIDISGEWQFAVGDTPSYSDHVTLPGSMLTNGKGDDVSVNTQWVGSLYDSSYYHNPYMKQYQVEGQMKLPFFLTPAKHYVGTAWYGRTVSVPKAWRGRRTLLFLERPHIETTVYVNGHEAGHAMSLSAPHVFDVTDHIIPGQDNRIDIKVYNGIENVCVGQDSHSVTDQTQGDWNGIVGRMELRSLPATYIRDVQVYPDVEAKAARVVIRLAGDVGSAKRKVRLSCAPMDDAGGAVASATASGRGDSLVAVMQMGDDVRLWDEFDPNLYQLTATLDGQEVRTVFGMREITIEGRQFLVNGRPVWLRGTVENCCFPLTGYPPTDEAEWLRVFSKCKEYGLNHMRFHSYCPPEAAFAAADKVGFYLQPEGPSWPNHGVRLGNGMAIDTYLMDETRRMVEAYGNHPSFCMLAAGNEPAGNWVSWVGDFVDTWRRSGDTRRVYSGASVGGGWAWDPLSQYHVKGGARGLDWSRRQPQSMDDYSQAIASYTQKGRTPVTYDINEPYISHEQGQWCAFPDLGETSQYTGVYKAGNFHIFADLLRDNGMASQARKFLMASGRLQTLAYKYEMERNLRTPGYAGFQLLGLNDYSGQGTALVGVLNVFWRGKGYCTAREWRRFCSPVVPLARFPRFTFTNADTLSVDVEMYNAYKDTLRNARTTYSILDAQGHQCASGLLSEGDLPVGKNIPLGHVTLPLTAFGEPQKLTLSVATQADNATDVQIQNQWDFWVYPSQVVMPEAPDILVTDTLDDRALQALASGGKVLLTAAGRVRLGSDVSQTFLPVFWNTSWFKMRPPHTTGACIDTSHPIFRHFPTDDWANLNWWELLNRAQVMNLRELPASYQPPIQPIDTWHVSRKLGMLLESNVLGGKLLMTTMDITSNLDRRIVARQMRLAILDYMSGPDFAPTLQLDPSVISDFFVKDAPAVNMFTNESPDELKPKLVTD